MLTNTQKLLDLIAQLRDPEKGCPWDVKQNFTSLVPYLIEESYEVIDAIERNDMDDLRLELGDLLLQVVFHAQIANEAGLFDFEQVAEGIADKLVRRHPHVFGDEVFTTDEQRSLAWEKVKQQEREGKKAAKESFSVMSDMVSSMPALMESEKVQGRAASYGFDWPEIAPVFDKLQEEIQEVQEAIALGNKAEIEEEVGDLLFVAVNLARHLKVNPELALKAATKKFIKRFQYIEQQVAKSNRQLADCDLAELDNFWNEAKVYFSKN